MEQNQQDYLTPRPHQTLPSLPNATTSLVLGILSIVICGIGFVLGIIGLVLANKDLALYRTNPGTYSENSLNNTKTGRICSIIGMIVSFFFILGYVIYIIWIISFMSSFKNASL